MKHLNRLFFVISILLVSPWNSAFSARVINPPFASSTVVYSGQPTTVTFRANISADTSLIRTSVNLITVDGNGAPLSTVALMYDDGTHGDAVASDGVFTTQVSINQSSPAIFRFEVSAAYRGVLARVKSAPVVVNVVTNPTPGPVTATAGSDTIAGTFTATNQTGGTLSINSGPLAGVTVVVPPGAVSGNTQFTLSQNNLTLTPNSGTFPGESISIHSNGQTTFSEPIRITVPFPDDGTFFPVPYYIDANGFLEACQLVSIDHAAGTVSFETFHASLFTWIYTSLLGETVTGTNHYAHTTYLPNPDGFQIVNYGSTVNPGGECFGISAFAQWFFRNLNGGLFPKYMQNIPVPSGGTKKGQNIIATRAHTSISRMWDYYWPGIAAQQNYTVNDEVKVITNMLSNTQVPAMLFLEPLPIVGGGTHAVLAYGVSSDGLVSINDPNYPGTPESTTVNLTYGDFVKITVIGDGTYVKEAFSNIYRDAENGFSGNGAAQVNVTSNTDLQHVTNRTPTLSGHITSGQILVDHLKVLLNETTTYEQDIATNGNFSLPISLITGTNEILFTTSGHDTSNNVKDAPNTQLEPFHLIYDNPNSVILVTLTWDTNNTDLDTYMIDPTGDYSSYYHKTTADGGQLDFDNTTGFGPEHWTLLGTKTVRWGQPYRYRVHYYSDHRGTNPGPAVPTRWTVSVLLYEGTPRATTYSYSGVLAYADASNSQPTGNSAGWADVATIVPVQSSSLALPAVPTMQKSSDGQVLITVPIPSEGERLQLKSASENIQ